MWCVSRPVYCPQNATMPSHFLFRVHTKTTIMRAKSVSVLLVDNPFHYRTVKTTLAVQHVVLITYYLRKEGLSNYKVTSRLTAWLELRHTSKQALFASNTMMLSKYIVKPVIRLSVDTVQLVMNTKHTNTT